VERAIPSRIPRPLDIVHIDVDGTGTAALCLLAPHRLGGGTEKMGEWARFCQDCEGCATNWSHAS